MSILLLPSHLLRTLIWFILELIIKSVAYYLDVQPYCCLPGVLDNLTLAKKDICQINHTLLK